VSARCGIARAVRAEVSLSPPRAQPWWRLEACTSLGLFLETPLCFIAY